MSQSLSTKAGQVHSDACDGPAPEDDEPASSCHMVTMITTEVLLGENGAGESLDAD